MAALKENKPQWSYITMNGCWKGKSAKMILYNNEWAVEKENKAQVRIKQWMEVENENKPQLSYITMSGCWKGE